MAEEFGHVDAEDENDDGHVEDGFSIVHDFRDLIDEQGCHIENSNHHQGPRNTCMQ